MPTPALLGLKTQSTFVLSLTCSHPFLFLFTFFSISLGFAAHDGRHSGGNESMLAQLGTDAEGSELRARLMSASLLSDMEAFKVRETIAPTCYVVTC